MSVEIKSVTPTPQSEALHPSLDIVLSIKYREDSNIPISVSGVFRGEDNRVLSHIFEVPSKTAYQLRLKAFHYSENRTNRDLTLLRTFRLILDQKTLDHIEMLREKNKKGDVVFQLDLTLSSLTNNIEVGGYGLENITLTEQGTNKLKTFDAIKLDPQNYNPYQGHLRMLIEQQGSSLFVLSDEPTTIKHTIHGSDWINDFQPQLGIGRFLVMEIPEILNINDQKDELGKRLHSATQRLKEIGELLRKGEWNDVAEDCRGIYEDLTKNYLSQFESAIKNLLRDTNGISDKGLVAFNEIIKNFGTYSHEFHHYRDEEGKAKQVIVNKEDAYALYVSLVGFVNMLTVKIHRQGKIESK